ncbi:putative ribonuclease H-like domain-containing protein [Tanacetum coccineum]|uniref:Ribonuclease H-like domain-containing protein n=1 Tax=Tanacetum coccineum TaxID=301880 RepID=A0ABQ5FPN6_9ASTR
MEAGTTFTNLTAKLPILSPGDYDLWLMMIEQYFLMTDYSLWEVIKNGNKVLKRTVRETKQEYEPTTAEEKMDMRNEMKARGTLLMTLPNKDQLKFHSYKDAKLLMKAIEKRYGGNKESKKVAKTYHSVGHSRRSYTQEDINLKLLRSLPSEWKTHALIWRNKQEIETIRLDDLYNNLKIYEPEISGSSSTTQNLQNVYFVSSNSTNSNSSTNEADNTAYGVSAAHTQSNPTSGDNLSDAVICAFLASQPNSSQMSREDLEQIDPDDLEEMDLQWEMTISKVDCYNCHKYGHFARECKAHRNQENRGREINRRTVTVETPTENALVAQDRIGGYDWSYQAEEEHPTNFALMTHTSSGSSFSSDSEVDSCSKSCVKAYATLKEQYDSLSSNYKRSQFNLVSYKAGLESVEARLAHYKKNEAVYEESINVLNLEVKLRDNALVENKKKLEKAEKERDELKLTLEKFQNSSKSLNNLLEIESFVNSSEMLENQEYNKSKSDKGYHAVPPPFTGNFIPRKPDLTFMDEIVKSENLDVTTVVTPSNDKTVESNHESANVKSNGDAVESKTVRKNSFRPPVIEDWNSDDESEVEIIPKDKTVSSSTKKIKLVKSARETVEKVETSKQNKHYPRGNQRNWNNLMSQRLGSDFKMINKACFVCGSFEHLHYVCDKKVIRPVWNNSRRVNHKNFANKMTHPHPNRRFVPQAVLTRSGKINTAGVSVNIAVRSVNTGGSKPTMNNPRLISNGYKRGYSQLTRPFNKYSVYKNSIFNKKVNTVRVKDTTARDRAIVSKNKGKWVNVVKASACWVWKAKNSRQPTAEKVQGKGVIDSGCSRHMTGNRCYLTKYEDYNGGFVSFGDGKGRISRKVLLRVPRKDNIYSVELKSVVPTKGLTCLFAKATIDESNLWHRRLGHINFKNMNKLVRGNLVRGLPSKIFENDHSCVACQKEKQHKASCKAKLVNSISKPLHMLHMDLFGPTNVKSLMKKSYCLVVTDDFSRFSWVFFLATKNETSEILKTFITEIENQLDHKVKVIRCDNGTEFKNSVMNQFCKMKGIKREFSIARTPQQNGVAERRNRTLIEAVRTMLVDSKLPTTFWAKVVNTTCYVLNRVLIIKPHNKAPYELIHGRPPLIDFMKPFGCPVTILNTRDHLGKFEGKANEGFFVGYFVVRKAMRVFNKRTRIVEETLNIRFLENTPNVTGNGPDWLFDVDSLTISMNYVQVVTGNQTNGIAGTRDNIVTDPKVSEEDAEEKTTKMDESGAPDKDGKDNQATRSESERLLQQEKQTVHPNSTNSINSVSTPVSDAGPSFTNDDPSSPVNAAEASNAFEEHPFERFSSFKNAFTLSPISNVTPMDDTRIFGNAYDDEDVGAEADLNNMETTINVSPILTTRIDKDHSKDQIIRDFNSAIQTRRMTKISDEHAMVCYINKQRRTNHKDYQNCLFAYFLSQMEPKKVILALEDPSWIEAMQEELLQFQLQKVSTLVNLPNGKRAIGTKWVFRNKKDERGIVVRNKARLVAQGYTQEEEIDYDEVFAHVARIEAIRLFLAYASFMGFIVYQVDVKSAFLYGTIDEEVYVCQPPSFEDLQFPNKVYKVEKALYGLYQAPRAWYETLSTYLIENGFRRGTIDKTLFIKKDKSDILLVQVYVDDIIFGLTKKSLCDEFEGLMHKRFQMSSMGELTFFLGLQQALPWNLTRLARKKEEEVNIALIESWDNTQAMMEADFELAQRLQAEEQGEITIEERSRLFIEFMNKRNKHFVMLRAEEKRRKPPTKAQKRNLMSTYLKNMGGYKYNQLKSKSYDEIHKLFDNEMKRVNTFIPMDSEVVKSKEGTEESSKRTEDELESDKSKKEESSEQKAKGSREKSLVQDNEEIEIDAIPLATKPPIIVEYKIVKEGLKGFYHLIRADGSSNRYSSMIRMLQNISREDLETLWKLVKTKYGNTRPEDDYEKVFWGDLKVMFEPDIKSEIWRSLLGFLI